MKIGDSVYLKTDIDKNNLTITYIKDSHIYVWDDSTDSSYKYREPQLSLTIHELRKFADIVELTSSIVLGYNVYILQVGGKYEIQDNIGDWSFNNILDYFKRGIIKTKLK